MKIALWLLTLQGVIGAFDTLYYHEWRARLPARGRRAMPELRLHAARDFLYAVLFGTLPWVAWQGTWTIILWGVIVAEIVLRRDLGDVYAGERVTHAVMGILYGAMLASLVPSLVTWHGLPTGLVFAPAPVPGPVRWALTLMAAGVFLSGVRDLYAALELAGGHWPWPRAAAGERGTA